MSDDSRILRFRSGSVPPSERAPWELRDTPPLPGIPQLDAPDAEEKADSRPASASPSAPGADNDGETGDEAETGAETGPGSGLDAPAFYRRRQATTTADGSTVLPFRRRDRERRVRRLRRHPLVRWSVPAVLALLIVSAPLAAVSWFAQSPRFALGHHDLAFEGAHRVDPAWVDEALQPFHGRNLWLLSLGDVERALERHPWIADVGLRKRPPNDLAVRIIERQERALVREGSRLVFVDADGRGIVPLDGRWRRPGIDLPILSGGNGSEASIAAAIALLDEIETVSPPWSAGLSEIEILSERDYRVHTVDLPFPLLVRKDTLEQRARRLQQLLPRILERFDAVAAVDLRFSRRIIIEPAGRQPLGRRASA